MMNEQKQILNESQGAEQAIAEPSSDKLIELKNKLIEKDQELLAMKTRALKVHEKNELLTNFPEVAAEKAQMEIMLQMASKFIKSGAFPNMTPEQAYTVMKAGREMGMKDLEALNSLYIVKGSINPYGKAMTSRLTKNGYRIEYLNETSHGVDVRVFKKDNHGEIIFDATEKVTDQDQIIKASNAAKFAKKNKMRYHGLRMIISFHLAHLFEGISDPFHAEYIEWKEAGRDKQAPSQGQLDDAIGELEKAFEAYGGDDKEMLQAMMAEKMQSGELTVEIVNEIKEQMQGHEVH